ncbi:MAG: hypothetical protein KBA49_03175, partial [Methanolinea sp.]|nr:hypothetical protein [Methanolinea sp.]
MKKVLGAGGGGGPLLRGNQGRSGGVKPRRSGGCRESMSRRGRGPPPAGEPGAVRRGETPPVRGSPGREYMLLYLVSQQSRNTPETLKLFSGI